MRRGARRRFDDSHLPTRSAKPYVHTEKQVRAELGIDHAGVATNPADAADGTIRKLFALSLGENSVHGSDSAENAAIEIKQFFTDVEIVG